MCKKIASLLMVCVLVFGFSGIIWADSPNDSPIRTGYAIVTPSGTSTTGLVVFETFGEREGDSMLQAGVLPANMTTDVVVFVDTNGNAGKNVGVAIANPGSTDAMVTFNLMAKDGTQVGTTQITVPAHNQLARFVTELFPTLTVTLQNFIGTLQITSNNPVAIVGLRVHGVNFSTMPVTSLSSPTPVPVVSTGIGGTGAVILPQFATGGGWATEIVIGNTGTSSLTVRVDLFANDGSALMATLNGQTASSFTNITIPPGGVFVLAPLDNEGQDEF
ncbi:MAG: hypothetical protein PHX83_14935 [Acidobacteriia bacterium]|nr:hypothetical protein [Terriglobia bacterium]